MKLFARRMIGVKQETTQNTFVAPVTADFLAAHDFTCKPAIEQLTSKVVARSLGSPANLPGKKSMDIDIKFWGKGSGVAGSEYPPFDAIMGAAGLSGSASASASVTYTPLNTSADSLHQGPCMNASIVGHYDGVVHNIPGVAGTMKWVLEAGKKWEIEFAGKGLYSSAIDGGLPASSGYSNTVKEPIVESITFVIDGVTLVVDKMEIDFGAIVQMFDDINAVDGVGGFTIVDRNPVGSFEAQMVNVATHNFFGRLETGTVMSGSCTIGTAAGNKFVITLPSIIYSNVQYVNKNGFIAVNATMKFNDAPSAATPWITVVAQ